MARKRREGVDGRRELDRLKEIAVVCKEKIKDLPRGERGRAWRKCLEEYLHR